jgi:hypothetical protein
MKKIMSFSLFSIFIVIIAHAQIHRQKPIFPRRFDTSAFNKLQRQLLIDSLREQLFENNKPYSYRMPVAGSMPKKFIYLGNNEKGFDVYQTMQDNMYILKPDSTFVSNMPVIKTPAEEGNRD